MRRTLSLMLAPTLVVTAVLAGTAQAQSLSEVLAAAYRDNPTLAAQRAALRVTDEGLPQALAGWRPTVKLVGSLARTDSFIHSGNFRANQWLSPGDVDFNVSQPIYDGGRTDAAVGQADEAVLAQRAVVDATEQTVLLQAVTAYMNVVRDQAVVELNINNEQVLRRQLDATRDRYRVGEITLTDVAQAEARLSGAAAERVAAEASLQNSRANFTNVVGRPPDKLVQPPTPTNLPASREEVDKLATETNPNIQAAIYTARSSDKGVEVLNTALMPSVALIGDVIRGNDSSNAPATTTTTYQGMVSVAVPLYQSGAEYSRIRQQKEAANQARIQVERARRDATEAADDSWDGLEAARARLNSLTSQIKASEIALEGVQREAQVGSRTVLDVLNAEQELLNARVNLVQAERDAIVSAYQVRNAIGTLTAAALELPVERFDPTAHYNQVRDQWIGTEPGSTGLPNF